MWQVKTPSLTFLNLQGDQMKVKVSDMKSHQLFNYASCLSDDEINTRKETCSQEPLKPTSNYWVISGGESRQKSQGDERKTQLRWLWVKNKGKNMSSGQTHQQIFTLLRFLSHFTSCSIITDWPLFVKLLKMEFTLPSVCCSELLTCRESPSLSLPLSPWDQTNDILLGELAAH